MRRNTPLFLRFFGLDVIMLAITAVVVASAAFAQPRAPGGDVETNSASAPDSNFTLGDCPDDLLRQAWLKEQPLQTAAVEAEVLALCTERAEAIAAFLRKRVLLDAALGRLQGPTSADATLTPQSPSLPESQVEALRAEVGALKDRIARLEREPQQPETEERLDQLRADLEVAEAELNLATETAPAETPADSGSNEAQAAQDPAAINLPDTSRVPQGSSNAAQPSTTAIPVSLPERPPVWNVLYAIRSADGPWQVALQATREIPITIPATDPNEPPTIRWQTHVDEPVTLAVNDKLSDGRTLLAVTDEGVTLGDPAARAVAQDLIPFEIDTTPGTLEWSYIKIPIKEEKEDG